MGIPHIHRGTIHITVAIGMYLVLVPWVLPIGDPWVMMASLDKDAQCQ